MVPLPPRETHWNPVHGQTHGPHRKRYKTGLTVGFRREPRFSGSLNPNLASDRKGRPIQHLGKKKFKIYFFPKCWIDLHLASLARFGFSDPENLGFPSKSARLRGVFQLYRVAASGRHPIGFPAQAMASIDSSRRV